MQCDERQFNMVVKNALQLTLWISCEVMTSEVLSSVVLRMAVLISTVKQCNALQCMCIV